MQMTGTVPFDYSMDEMEDKWGPPAGKELHFKGWLYDWYWQETQNGTAVTKMIHDGVKVIILGPRYRTFKPGKPFTAHVIKHKHFTSSNLISL